MMDENIGSCDWALDLHDIHSLYGFHEKVSDLNKDKLKQLLVFRIAFLLEELQELRQADTAEDVVDAVIDLCVVAVGTLDLFGVDIQKAWYEVYRSNVTKRVGLNPSRPNPFGFPDLIKPDGWVGPNHKGNTGTIPNNLQE